MSEWSEKCLDDLKSDQMFLKASRWSEKCPDNMKSVWMIWKKFRKFETAQIIWKVSRCDLWSVHVIWEVFRWYAQCLGDLESGWMISKMSRSSVKCALCTSDYKFRFFLWLAFFLHTFVSNSTMLQFTCSIRKNFVWKILLSGKFLLFLTLRRLLPCI